MGSYQVFWHSVRYSGSLTGEAHTRHLIVLSGPRRVLWFFSSSDVHHLFIPVSALTLICLEIG